MSYKKYIFNFDDRVPTTTTASMLAPETQSNRNNASHSCSRYLQILVNGRVIKYRKVIASADFSCNQKKDSLPEEACPASPWTPPCSPNRFHNTAVTSQCRHFFFFFNFKVLLCCPLWVWGETLFLLSQIAGVCNCTFFLVLLCMWKQLFALNRLTRSNTNGVDLVIFYFFIFLFSVSAWWVPSGSHGPKISMWVKLGTLNCP